MGKNCLVNFKYVYFSILLLLLIAWFGHSSTKPSATTTTTQDKKSTATASQFAGDEKILGLKPDSLVVGGKCNIEYLNDVLMNADVHPVLIEKPLNISGWAMDVDKTRLPTKVIVRFTDTNSNNYYSFTQIGLNRPDVSEYFDLPKILNASGFELISNNQDYPAGQYSLTLIVLYENDSYICANRRLINVQ